MVADARERWVADVPGDLPMELQRSGFDYVSVRDLSRVPAFRVGPLRVDPPTRTIAGDAGGSVTLEPRVMQVLVALGLDAGLVLSRDDLIALCWDGRIVGDNAINRVISLLRQALAAAVGDAVRVETIARVGFRIVASEIEKDVASSQDEARAPKRFGRRAALAGGGLLLFAAGFGGYRVLRPTPVDPRAVRLAREADLLMKSGLPGSTRQATRNLERAVAIAPDYADGWGYLALMYRHALQGFSKGERENFPRMVDSAAARALALQPDQPDARLALALKRPFYRRWFEAEADLRAILRDYPDHWYANGQLGLLLMDVGRATDALPYRERVIAIDPKIPVAWTFLALARLHANRLHEADDALDRAFAVWPNHPALWMARYRVLLETARPAEAAAFVRTPAALPEAMPAELAALLESIALAIADGGEGGRSRVASRMLESLTVPEDAEDGAGILALLGRDDYALDAAAACLLGGSFAGRTWPAPDRYAMRSAAMLFYPSLRELADRPGYARILRESGLEDYWKRSGSQPDFRRS
jgi:DNA-binding winged helix-turn-helix (wHTH) protein/tetratricopeptide (TPR) repeat protein